MRSIPTLVTVFALRLCFPLPISLQTFVAAWEKAPLSAGFSGAAQDISEDTGMGTGRLQPPWVRGEGSGCGDLRGDSQGAAALDRDQNTQEQPPGDGHFSCEDAERDSRDQQLAFSSPGSDGARGAAVSSPPPNAHCQNQLPHQLPLYTCWAPPRPQPGEGGFLPALTSLLTPTRSQKDLISCSLLGFGNYPLGWEVLVMDGEVLLGQTVARCFSLWRTKCLPGSKESAVDFFPFLPLYSSFRCLLGSWAFREDGWTQPEARGIRKVPMRTVGAGGAKAFGGALGWKLSW
ncbi:uncharacterized protein LOC116964086 [Tyto alba]|uniref:uncharacterized protein LOC116964086 n=1 Tax=Tyto alba TaxID=56313 RepID=UPI001C67058C|nr:uncharacterized protein LOC116964086 [Tyto alba]